MGTQRTQPTPPFRASPLAHSMQLRVALSSTRMNITRSATLIDSIILFAAYSQVCPRESSCITMSICASNRAPQRATCSRCLARRSSSVVVAAIVVCAVSRLLSRRRFHCRPYRRRRRRCSYSNRCAPTVWKRYSSKTGRTAYHWTRTWKYLPRIMLSSSSLSRLLKLRITCTSGHTDRRSRGHGTA